MRRENTPCPMSSAPAIGIGGDGESLTISAPR